MSTLEAEHAPRPRTGGAAPAGLNPREPEVWQLPATGPDNAEIARALSSASTVNNHITGIFTKPDVRDRAQAVIAAYEAGLVAAGHGGGWSPSARRGPESPWRPLL